MAFPFKDCSSILLFSGDAAHGIDPDFFKQAAVDIDGTILLWSKSGKRLITSTMNESKARAAVSYPIHVFGSGGSSQAIKELMPKGKIGLDFSHLTASRYLRLCKAFGQKRLVDISPTLERLRAAKSAQELRHMAKAVRIAKEILGALELSPSMTELDVVQQLARRCVDAGVSFSFPPIVAAGPHAGHPHHTPTNKRLGNGIVLIDFGVQYQHYCSDLTRCYFLGAAKAERAQYARCQAIHDAIIDQLPACATAGDVVALADREVKKAGWPRLIHSIGHGIGLDVHESPGLYTGNPEKLLPNTPMAIEPGWYGPKFGVRFENNVVWGKKKARML